MQKLSSISLLGYCLIFLLILIPLSSFIYSPQKIISQIPTGIMMDFFLYMNHKLEFKPWNDNNMYNKDIENTLVRDSEYKIDRMIVQNVEKDTELKQLLEEISMLEKLPYTNNKISDWENRVLELLEKGMGKDSDCYKQFHGQTQQGFWWRPNVDPRMIIVSQELYQQEYTDHLNLYKKILQLCLET